VDGDGKLDLAVHRLVRGDSWFGASAELILARGTGAGFIKPQLIKTDNAAISVDLIDWDGDGDLDLLAPQVDVGIGNLARALVSKEVSVDVGLHLMEGGTWAVEPIVLAEVDFPIDNPDQLQQAWGEDLTGDGIGDLLTTAEEGRVLLFAGSATGLAEKPSGSVVVTVPRGGEPLFVHDFSGDGAGEVLVWGPGQRQGTLLRWLP
jgi:hypothetical protein